MSEMKIIGTINRICPSCKKDRRCTMFSFGKESSYLCAECMQEKHNIKVTGKKIVIFKEFCPHCRKITMEKQDSLTEVTDTRIINHYVCSECHETKKIIVKIWRKKE